MNIKHQKWGTIRNTIINSMKETVRAIKKTRKADWFDEEAEIVLENGTSARQLQ